MAFSRDSKYLIVLDGGSAVTQNLNKHQDSDWSLKVWDIEQNRIIDELKIKRTRYVYNMAVDQKKSILAIGREGQIWLYSINLL